MGNTVVAESRQVMATLADWCARNSPAEIHYATPDAQIRTARVRLLLLEDGTICTDKPQNLTEGVDLRSGQAIQVFVTVGEDRWAFTSRIAKMTRLVRLNQRQRLIGMAIDAPTEIQPYQRRRDFRVSVASSGIPCEVTAVSDDGAAACDIDAMPLRAEIANLSARGMGVVLMNVPESCFATGATYFLDFELPDTGERFVLLAESRHARQVKTRNNLVVGFSFHPTPGVDPLELRKKLNAFLAAEQRRKMRRRR